MTAPTRPGRRSGEPREQTMDSESPTGATVGSSQLNQAPDLQPTARETDRQLPPKKHRRRTMLTALGVSGVLMVLKKTDYYSTKGEKTTIEQDSIGRDKQAAEAQQAASDALTLDDVETISAGFTPNTTFRGAASKIPAIFQALTSNDPDVRDYADSAFIVDGADLSDQLAAISGGGGLDADRLMSMLDDDEEMGARRLADFKNIKQLDFENMTDEVTVVIDSNGPLGEPAKITDIIIG